MRVTFSGQSLRLQPTGGPAAGGLHDSSGCCNEDSSGSRVKKTSARGSASEVEPVWDWALPPPDSTGSREHFSAGAPANPRSVRTGSGLRTQIWRAHPLCGFGRNQTDGTEVLKRAVALAEESILRRRWFASSRRSQLRQQPFSRRGPTVTDAGYFVGAWRLDERQETSDGKWVGSRRRPSISSRLVGPRAIADLEVSPKAS